MKTDKDKNTQIYGLLIAAVFFLPLLAIPWLEYFKLNDIIINIFTIISAITTPIGVLIIYIFSNPVYNAILEDKKNNIKIKEMKTIDIFYRYVPADMVKLTLIFTFLGMATIIVFSTEDTDWIVRLFGDKIFFETCVLAPLALAFYTLWTFYCNGFSTKKGKKKYMLIAVLIVVITVFIALNI